ncbi:MAG TPA: GNAT family N-acetyltransferase [Roseiflexaceae bacterium]|nr:GNAT family N-acetyltransferase [Roseiflexaceae bacterium]
MSTPSRWHIRDARKDERQVIHDLTLVAYGEFAGVMAASAWAALREALLAGLAAEHDVERIVAEQDGAPPYVGIPLVGSVMLYSPAAKAYGDALASAGVPELRLLAVAPHARGQGVGTALVVECAQRARRAGASALGLHTSESLRAGIRMYERMGFVRAPEGDFQPEGAELVMAYRLALGDRVALS